jgi:hypothetical protein
VVQRPTAPSAAEKQQIDDWCVNRSGVAPTFVVPNNNSGPGSFRCGRMSLLGCAGLARACKTVPVTDEERRQCRDFLAGLRDAEICR